MNKETTVEAEAEAKVKPPVLILPGHLFFVERIELPEALDNSEIEDFAELSLEGMAPFPIEQLYWGFIYSESSSSLMVYAAFRDRVKALGFDQLDSYTWVLPDFATLSGAYFPEPTTLVLEGEDACSRIHFDVGETLPLRIYAAPSSNDHAEDGKNSPVLRVELESTKVNDRGLPTFHFQAIDRSNDALGNWRELSPTETDLWRADVRDAAFKTNERNTRRLTKWVTRSTAYAILLAVLFVLLEGALYIGNIWLETQRAEIAEQATAVRTIEDKQSLMNKLDQVAQNELRPIAILGALNESRPSGIYFTSTVTEGQNKIIIEGIASTVNELNSYITGLQTSGRFELIEDKYLVRGGKTTFTATLTYIHSETGSPGDEGGSA